MFIYSWHEIDQWFAIYHTELFGIHNFPCFFPLFINKSCFSFSEIKKIDSFDFDLTRNVNRRNFCISFLLLVTSCDGLGRFVFIAMPKIELHCSKKAKWHVMALAFSEIQWLSMAGSVEICVQSIAYWKGSLAYKNVLLYSDLLCVQCL